MHPLCRGIRGEGEGLLGGSCYLQAPTRSLVPCKGRCWQPQCPHWAPSLLDHGSSCGAPGASQGPSVAHPSQTGHGDGSGLHSHLHQRSPLCTAAPCALGTSLAATCQEPRPVPVVDAAHVPLGMTTSGLILGPMDTPNPCRGSSPWHFPV